jgi:hypothetical protein
MRIFTAADLFLGSKLKVDVSPYRCNHCGAPFFVWESREMRERIGLQAIPCPVCKNSNFELHLWQLGLITVKIESELTRELADFTLIDRDLKAVISACDRLLTEISHEPPDDLLCSALWTHAVIKYMRCFGPSGRTFAKTEPFIKDELKDKHNWFKKLRDWHTAHSFNIFEQAAVGAVISAPDEDEKRIFEVGVLDYAATYPADDKLIVNLRTLAVEVLSSVTGKVADLYAAVRKEQESISIEKLYEPGRERLHLIADLSNPSKRRKQ